MFRPFLADARSEEAPLDRKGRLFRRVQSGSALGFLGGGRKWAHSRLFFDVGGLKGRPQLSNADRLLAAFRGAPEVSPPTSSGAQQYLPRSGNDDGDEPVHRYANGGRRCAPRSLVGLTV